MPCRIEVLARCWWSCKATVTEEDRSTEERWAVQHVTEAFLEVQAQPYCPRKPVTSTTPTSTQRSRGATQQRPRSQPTKSWIEISHCCCRPIKNLKVNIFLCQHHTLLNSKFSLQYSYFSKYFCQNCSLKSFLKKTFTVYFGFKSNISSL